MKTPLGEDALLLRSMTANERISALFEYRLDLSSEDIDIAPSDLLGKPATVSLRLMDGSKRWFNGWINRFSHVGFDGADALYKATLVPWLWFLSRTADCRIFQEQTVPDIVKSIFREHGFTDFEERLSGSYRQWVYCVQYRETDLSFVSRLLEHEGIYYFFEHQDGKHHLILADSYSAHSTIAGYEEVPYYPPDADSLRERDHINTWSIEQQVRPGAFANTSFDFTAPRKNLLATRSSPKPHELADYEVFDYPGNYVEAGDSETYARVRMEEAQAIHEIAKARGTARGLAPGALFSLTGHRREDQNREYLILSADYRLRSDEFGSFESNPAEPVFASSLTVMDAQTPFRPARETPKPVVQGPQTAIVVGTAGEEIWTDQYGRVKIQFHWDRYGKQDENSSCWVRVSHPWAGKNWGAVAIPRIGQEVIVEFLEGDPDQPIITGRVYNGDCMPPYGLPDSAVISGLKSNSTKGGAGYNEMIMDDTKGNELIRIHGQYDMSTTIQHDQTDVIHNKRTTTVGVDDTETIGSNQAITVGSDQTTSVGSNQKLEVGSDQTNLIGAIQKTDVGANQVTNVGGSRTLEVQGDRSSDVIGNDQVTVGGNQTISVAGSIEITSSTKITLSAAGSIIEIGPAGITIQSAALVTVMGATIKLN
ncbi:type VI secretion system Vgr family protein [Thiocapsa sp.]|uniref:type VI secretion system Vgr family protein n=1 Tax=Thiocapsa sp. TaxID=2024551 RepID=UPI00261E9364|nr:type VI secretion system tip protein VgrG [Thiocapsa sp.]